MRPPTFLAASERSNRAFAANPLQGLAAFPIIGVRSISMNAVPFDTLKRADRLQAGGFTTEQARTFASSLAEAANAADVVTKPYLDDRLVALEQRLNLDGRLFALEQRLTIRLGGMLVVAVGVLLAAIRYLPAH
jgi:hypothetical protein